MVKLVQLGFAIKGNTVGSRSMQVTKYYEQRPHAISNQIAINDQLDVEGNSCDLDAGIQ